MNIDQLLSQTPTEVIKEQDVEVRINQEKELVEAGKSFVSQLSLNRFFPKKLVDLTFEERVNLFSVLGDFDFVFEVNQLYFSDYDTDSFAHLLEERFGLESMYELDNVFIENLLNGTDITMETVEVNGDETNLAELLQRFVISTFGMSSGDTPNVLLMLVVKKALIGSYLAEKNVESLLAGDREIYDISPFK